MSIDNNTHHETTFKTPAWWEGSCIKCGHMLRGADSPICPECGSTIHYYKDNHVWPFRMHLVMAIIGFCFGFFSLFFGFDGPGIIFTIFIIIPLAIRQRFSLLRTSISIIASIAGYSVVYRVIITWNAPMSGIFGGFLFFTLMGIAGMFFLCLILFWNNWKQFFIAILISVIASIIFVAIDFIESGYDLLISFGVWQSIMAFTLSWLLNYKIVPVESES